MSEVKTFDIKALRQKAIESDDIKTDVVYVEEWDAEFPVRSLSGAALKLVNSGSKNAKGERDEFRLLFLAAIYGCATHDGQRVFANEDLALFESDKKSAAPLIKIGTRVMEISSADGKAKVDAKN